MPGRHLNRQHRLVIHILQHAIAESVGAGPSLALAPVVVVGCRCGWAAAAVGATLSAKWLLIGRYRAGRYPVWGGLYARHWVVTRVAHHLPWALVDGTVFAAVILRLLGARVGRRVYIHAGVDLGGGGWDLLTLGDDVTVGQDARVAPAELEAGYLVFGAVTLGDGATLDVRSAVSPGGTVGPNGYLAALSWVPPGVTVPGGERWDGVPARPAAKGPGRPASSGGYPLPPVTHGLLVLTGRVLWPVVVVTGVLLATSALLPDIDRRLAGWLGEPGVTWAGAAAVCVLVPLFVPLGLVARGLAARLCGRVQPGVYSLWSLAALRIRLKTEAVDAAGYWLSGSLAWPWWLRLAGMRIGRRCEISTLINLVPDTVELGDGCFLTDGIYLGGPTFHRGTVAIAGTRLGAGTFVGNQAVVAAGHDWPDGLFVGVSTAPDPHRVWPMSGWFGHPPMELPHRAGGAADPQALAPPSTPQVVRRMAWESLRCALPLVPAAAWYGWYVVIVTAADSPSPDRLLAAVAATAAVPAACIAAAIGIKWCVLGRVRPGQHELWSGWCCRWEFAYVAWEHLARGPVSGLEGTLLLNAVLRATGMRIGRRVSLGGGAAAVVDPDMIEIEDGATVSADFQAHTFENRVLKIGRVRVGKNASMGAHAVVLYGSEVGGRSQVSPHSVVMKGDVLAVGGQYCGCPVTDVAISLADDAIEAGGRCPDDRAAHRPP